MDQPTVTREIIVQGLRRLGLDGGEAVMVHSSLSRFGHVDGGAEAVIDALREAVSPGGTVVMSALTITPAFVAAHVRAARQGRIDREHAIFDVAETPTWAGRIPETFRHQPDVIRSWHPSHSVAAAGPLAEELVADHHTSAACGRGSPYERITQRDDGRILLLGVGHEVSTTMHGFEQLAGLPYVEHPEVCRIPIRTPEGEALAETRLHIFHIQRELGRLESRYISAAAETVTCIGAAVVRLCRARMLRNITLKALEQDPWALVTPRGRRTWEQMKATGNVLDPAARSILR